MPVPSKDPRVRSLGARVREIRNLMGLSQSEVARRAEISRMSLHTLEAGTGGSPNYSTLLAVADAIGVRVIDLVPR